MNKITKETPYLDFPIIVFKYNYSPNDPAIFKIENNTRLPVMKELTGKAVFLHNEIKSSFEDGKKYLCAGKVTWREGEKFEIFIPEKVFVKEENGRYKEIVLPDKFKNRYLISGEENKRDYSELEELASQNCCS